MRENDSYDVKNDGYHLLSTYDFNRYFSNIRFYFLYTTYLIHFKAIKLFSETHLLFVRTYKCVMNSRTVNIECDLLNKQKSHQTTYY